MVRRHSNLDPNLLPSQLQTITVSNASDGTGRARPRNGCTQYDLYAQRIIADMYVDDATTNVQKQGGRQPHLSALPQGYTCWQRPRAAASTRLRTTRKRTWDEYEIHGHPQGKFTSMNDFYQHFKHLQQRGNAPGCPCKMCHKHAARNAAQAGGAAAPPAPAPPAPVAAPVTVAAQNVPAQGNSMAPSAQQPVAQPLIGAQTTQGAAGLAMPSSQQSHQTQQGAIQQQGVHQHPGGAHSVSAPAHEEDTLPMETIALTVSAQPAAPHSAALQYHQFHHMDPIPIMPTRISYDDAISELDDGQGPFWPGVQQNPFALTYGSFQAGDVEDGPPQSAHSVAPHLASSFSGNENTQPDMNFSFTQSMIPIDQYLSTAASYIASSGLFAPGLGPFSLPSGDSPHVQTAFNAESTLPDFGYTTANPPTAVAPPEQSSGAEIDVPQDMLAFDPSQGFAQSWMFNHNGSDSMDGPLPNARDAFENLLAQQLENDRLGVEDAADADRVAENQCFADFVEIDNDNGESTMITCDFCGQEHDLEWACPEFNALEYPVIPTDGVQQQSVDDQTLDPQLR